MHILWFFNGHAVVEPPEEIQPGMSAGHAMTYGAGAPAFERNSEVFDGSTKLLRVRSLVFASSILLTRTKSFEFASNTNLNRTATFDFSLNRGIPTHYKNLLEDDEILLLSI